MGSPSLATEEGGGRWGGRISCVRDSQIDRDDAADYTKDLSLFQASIDFVKGGCP
jgi:hypothetical protein